MRFKIELTRLAAEMLAEISDRKTQAVLFKRIEGLAESPERQGKALTGRLRRYRSVRAAGQRYRIIYQVDAERHAVVVLGVGIRKEGDRRDIYTRLEKLSEPE